MKKLKRANSLFLLCEISSAVLMISHKKSLITIFGQKHKIKNFIKKLIFFTKKLQWHSILVHIWDQIANFEGKLHQKSLINFEQNDSCDQKMLLLEYFKVYIILFLL